MTYSQELLRREARGAIKELPPTVRSAGAFL